MRVDKPWGYELRWAKTERYVGKIIHVDAGQALSLQYHRVKDETLLVWSGPHPVRDGRGDTRATREMGPGGQRSHRAGHGAPHDRPRDRRHLRGVDTGASRTWFDSRTDTAVPRRMAGSLRNRRDTLVPPARNALPPAAQNG